MPTVVRLTPDRAARSAVVSGATFVGGVAGMLARSEVPYPRPGSDAATIRGFFQGNHGAARVGAAGQLLSAVTLGRFTASVVRLAGFTGPSARRLEVAAAMGGATAVASLAGSGLISAALTRDDARSDEETVALHRRAFLSGGIVHGVGFGLLVGALGIAGRRTGALPDGLTTAALGSAAAGLLTPLYFAAEPAALLIPIGRFSGLVITGIAGLRLARGLG
jgi:hypothetical protein